MNGNAELGPDQVGDIANPGSIRGGRALRQLEVAAQDRVLVFGRERDVLGDIGLDEAELDARQHGAGRRGEPEGAEGGDQRERERGEARGSKVEPALADAPQRRWRGEDGDGQEREPVQADERGDLSQREIASQRHAEVVPGKAGEEEAARPFSEPEPEREGENARWAGRPQEPRDRKARSRKDRKDRRQGDDAKRQRPGELVRLDQERRADPPEPGEKIAEAHPPAGPEGGAHRAEPAVLRAVDQPDRDRQRQGDEREQRKRRQRQRPGRARDEGDGAPAPAPGQDDPLDERGQDIGAGHDAGIGNAQGNIPRGPSNRHRRP